MELIPEVLTLSWDTLYMPAKDPDVLRTNILTISINNIITTEYTQQTSMP